MRKIAAALVMAAGMIILVAAMVAFAGSRFSLPPRAEQTESQWIAYEVHKWAFLLVELPLGLSVFSLGYLLWPSRLVDNALAWPAAAFVAVAGLGGTGGTAFVVNGLLQHREPFMSAPWLSIQGCTMMSGLVVLAGMAVHKLVQGEEGR